VLIGVDDALLAQGEQLAASVAAAGARAEVVLRLPDSIDEAPKELRADRRSVELPSGPARRRASAGPRTTA
jgi:hypothetical protein